MRKLLVIQILILCFYLLSCNNADNHSTLSLGKGKDVKVSLNILDSKGIKKIEFKSNGDNHSVTENELTKYNTIDYGFNGKGERTFKVFVYTNFDTLKSEHYVEEGYTVKLECDSSHVKTLEHSGY
jgi:hypothetical protein